MRRSARRLAHLANRSLSCLVLTCLSMNVYCRIPQPDPASAEEDSASEADTQNADGDEGAADEEEEDEDDDAPLAELIARPRSTSQGAHLGAPGVGHARAAAT